MSNKNKINKISLFEYRIAVYIFILGLIFRIFYVFQYHFDTDESQHLHVVWAWIKGLLQYRDVFDNHTPLFHILCVPLLFIIGERSSALYFMRLAMVPLFVLGMFCTYSIGRNLFSKRVGIWSSVLVSIYPDFFFCSLEFRGDILWMVLWLAGFAIILGKQLTKRRSFFAGLLFGVSLCVSMKTILLLFSLAVAVIFNIPFIIKNYKKILWGYLLNNILLALVGFLFMPLVIIAFYARQRALDSLFYCVINHNVLSDIGQNNGIWRILLFMLFLPVLFWLNRKFITGVRQSILFFTTTIYFVSLYTIWPIATMQNFLPIFPLISILLISKILEWIKKIYPVMILVSISVIEIVVILFLSPPWENQTQVVINMIDEVLKLTDRNDWVMDQKGETVFRRRPYYYILETITRERFKRGLITDDIAEGLINKRCYVATNDISRFPPNARKFIWENYILIGYIRVVGKFLEPCNDKKNVFRFEILIPADYVIMGQYGRVEGRLDNIPYNGARFLDAGIHEFILDKDVKQLAVFWAQAAEKGFTPFLS